LIVDDIDAPEGDWVHWVIYDIPPKTAKIAQNSKVGSEGLTDFGTFQYRGPCPANKRVHRYSFRVYALSDRPDLAARRNDLYVAAVERHGAHAIRIDTRTPTDDKLPNYDPNAPLSKSFGNPVHCVRVSNDNLVYVCDRQNNRVQVFSRDGEFKHEFRVEVQTLANGSVWDMVLSHDPAQRYLYVADGANGRIYILRRSDGRELGSFGRTGRMPGEFKWIHNIAIDRDGNLFTSEVGFGRRVQKFARTGGAF